MNTNSARNFLGCLLVISGILFQGCVQAPPRPQKSILQIRELQTREFQISDQTIVMRAVLNSLQDDGFIVRNAVTELGLLTAIKEKDLSPQSGWGTFLQGALSDREVRWPKTQVIEANATVSPFGKTVRVRISFQQKTIDNFGTTIEVSDIEDALFYQNFFAQIEHSVFLQRERI